MSEIHTVIAVDFDGTIVKHAFPDIGEPIPQAISYLHSFIDLGAGLILWTCRDDQYLADAVHYLQMYNIRLIGANKNPYFPDQSKPFAHFYIDDRALGAPLVMPPEERPYLDWSIVGPEALTILRDRKRRFEIARAEKLKGIEPDQ